MIPREEKVPWIGEGLDRLSIPSSFLLLRYEYVTASKEEKPWSLSSSSTSKQ